MLPGSSLSAGFKSSAGSAFKPYSSAPSFAASSATLVASRLYCGDTLLSAGEQCDDGNLLSGDGCSATCQIEIFQNCGNYTVDPGEECDAGVRGSADCSPRCKQLAGICGDSRIQTLRGEQCDDGNISSGDGCSADCRIEMAAECGDGVLNPETEQCDDGTDNSAAPSACRTNCTLPFCGDGIVDYNEQCDPQSDNTACTETCEIRLAGAGEPIEAGITPLPEGIKTPSPVRTPTGPGLVIFLASGAAAGVGWMRKRVRAK